MAKKYVPADKTCDGHMVGSLVGTLGKLNRYFNYPFVCEYIRGNVVIYVCYWEAMMYKRKKLHPFFVVLWRLFFVVKKD